MYLVKIESAGPNLIEDYDRYLAGQEASLVYHSSKFKEFLLDLLHCEEDTLVARGEGGIRGILPILSLAGPHGRVYNSLPFYGSHGGILADDPAARQALARAYSELAGGAGTLSSTIVMNPFDPVDQPVLPHNFTDRRIGQFTPLRGGEDQEAILARIDPAARRNVRKALREGVTVDLDPGQMDALRRMHQANMAEIGGTPKTDTFFRLVSEYFRAGEDYDLYVGRRDGQVIAALLVFYFNRTVEYFVPAIEHEYRTVQPLSAILVTALSDASRRGYERWNWGGTWTTQMGVYRFKKKWAADERMYMYYTQLNDKSVLNLSPPEIVQRYPHFFVVPFNALHPNMC